MKRNLLLTVNFNQKLCPNARASLTDAAQRWNFDYLEIRCPTREGYYPSYEKLFQLALVDYTVVDTVIWIDADMLVRSDTPSPQEVFGPGIHMGSDIQPGQPPEVIAAMLKEVHIDKFGPITQHDPAKKVSYDQYIAVVRNAGLIVVKMPAPVHVFADMLPLIPPSGSVPALNGHHEQAITNYCTCAVPGANLVFEPKWNWREPPEGPMHSYVYHYTGWGYLAERERIKTFDWHTKA